MRFRSFFALLAAAPLASGATTTPDSLSAQRVATNRRGMITLASWGAASALGGTIGYFTAGSEEAKRFYQMNAFWGAINLTIAGLGYFAAQREATAKYSATEAFRKHNRTRRIFLLNAGLDGLYMGAGLYMRERALRSASEHPDLLRGYGNAVILQGAALLVFDAVMYTLQGRLEKPWQRWLERVAPSDAGIGLKMHF